MARGLCPRCGSSNVHYNERFGAWHCFVCESSFPTPSYGPDQGKVLPANPAFSRRSDPLIPTAKSLSPAKTFIVLLGAVAGFFIIWAIYLLVASKTGFLTAGTIIAVNAGVIFWARFLLNRFKVEYLPMMLISAIIVMLGLNLGQLSGFWSF